MFQFIESIKVEDQKIYLLDLHQQRVNDTFSHFNKDCQMDLSKIFQDLKHNEDGLYKFKIWYDLDNKFRTMMIPYAISEVKDFEFVSDDQLEYNLKFENRKVLDHYKAKSSAGEVIFLKNGEITDTTFSNLLFLKDKIWYTPSAFLLNGVQRQHLLKTGKVKTATITPENIKEYSHFQLINALNDFDDMFIYPLERIVNLTQKITIDDI